MTNKKKNTIRKNTPKFDETFDWGLKISLAASSILILTYFIYPSILTEIISTIKIH